MLGSHEGLRDQYEVSCKELDILVEAAQKIDGVFGSRMMGGGFGGCTINIVKEEAIDRFKRKIMEEYQEKTGITPEIYLTKVSGGTQFINES
jgi:galactokinase